MSDRQGVMVGNIYDKYGSRNPLVRRLMAEFFSGLSELIQPLPMERCLEVGCGEGQLMRHLKALRKEVVIWGSDISEEMARVAADMNRDCSLIAAAVESLPFETGAFDLVMACEVLEHVARPHEALAEIERVTNSYVLVSVPWEPIWRLLNLLRGSYITRWGNTPGHVNHWSRQGFIRLLERHLTILEVKTPLPWTMALCQKR